MNRSNGNDDSSRTIVEWARGGAWMHMVKSQKDINPYKLFGCGIRVVTFDGIISLHPLHFYAHNQADVSLGG